MIRVNGNITLSSELQSTLNERKLKQNTHLKQDLCSGFRRKSRIFTGFLHNAIGPKRSWNVPKNGKRTRLQCFLKISFL